MKVKKLYVIEYCPPKGKGIPVRDYSGTYSKLFFKRMEAAYELKILNTVEPKSHYRVSTFVRLEKG